MFLLPQRQLQRNKSQTISVYLSGQSSSAKPKLSFELPAMFFPSSWPEPQHHVVSGSEGQPELGFACTFWQWHKEPGPPRKRAGSGSPWKEIQKC